MSGVDYTIKLLQPTPLPLDDTEDDFVHRIEKRKADAAEVTSKVAFSTYLHLWHSEEWRKVLSL